MTTKPARAWACVTKRGRVLTETVRPTKGEARLAAAYANYDIWNGENIFVRVRVVVEAGDE